MPLQLVTSYTYVFNYNIHSYIASVANFSNGNFEMTANTIIPYSAKFWRGKTLANQSLANLEFGWVKYWRMMYSSPNSPKFSPARILRYMVFYFISCC